MQTFNLDLSKKGVIPLLNAKQRDVGTKILINITDNGKEYAIPAGASFSVWFSGKSGEGNYTTINGVSAFAINGNTVTVELIMQMLNNPGEHLMCLVMNGAEGSQLGLWNIPYYVEGIPGADSEVAQQHYQASVQAQKKAEEAAEVADDAKELAIQSAQTATDASERAEAAAERAEAGAGASIIVALDEGNMATHTALEIYNAMQNHQIVVFREFPRAASPELIPIRLSTPSKAVFSKPGYPTEFDSFDIKIDGNGQVSYETHFSSDLVLRSVEKVETDIAPVSYLPQTLTPERQAQARENIGAQAVFSPSGYGLPIVYFTGNTNGISKDDKVTLNYKFGDRTGTCTLKWQGSSSLSYPKKNYTVAFDTAFEAVDGWGEQSKYCLKADWIDFSHCRNVVSAKLWGKIVKSRSGVDPTLAALPNGGAVDGFPCFVVINGEWQGVYNFNIPKEGWMMGMGNGEKEAILCAGNANDATRFRAEAVVDTDFDLEYHSDGFTESQIQDSLNALIRAVMNSDGTDFDTTIAQYLDIDSAIDYFIFSILSYHFDGIGKNYILATYDGVKWFYSAYDMDSTWGLHWCGQSFMPSAYESVWYNAFSFAGHSDDDSHKLLGLLYKHKKDEIVRRYKELRKNFLSVSYVGQLFKNYASNIPIAASNAEAELWKQIPSTETNNVGQIERWYADRVRYCDEEIKQMDEMLDDIGTDGIEYMVLRDTTGKARAYACKGIGTATDTDVVIAKYVDDFPVTHIWEYAFQNNTDIKSVAIPHGVTNINTNAFYHADNLESVELPDTVTAFAGGSFGYTKITSLTVPNGVTVIPGYFANQCRSLRSIKMGNRVTGIGASAFENADALTDVRLSKTLKTIGNNAFARLGNALEIGNVAPVIIPKNVETIGAGAFNRMWKCQKVVFKGTPTSIAADAFIELGGNAAITEVDIYVPWAEGEVANAPWGATKATIHYNSAT